MAPEQIDVYRDWLKITDNNRPLNYYQLLRLRLFEDDLNRIRAHYQKLANHVREEYLQGPHAAEARKLLDELARAMFCLTDRQRKQEYDAALGRADVVQAPTREFAQILLFNKVLTVEQLEKAKRFAETVGIELRDAIVQQKLAPVEQVMLAYAEAHGLPYVELSDVTIDESLIPLIPPKLARQYSFLPLFEDGERLIVAAASPLVPDVEEELRLRIGKPIRTVLCRPASLNEAIAKYYPRDVPYQPLTKPAPAAMSTPAETTPRKSAEPASETGVLGTDKVRQSVMYAIIAFNLAVVVAVLAQVIISPAAQYRFSVTALIAILVGLVAGGLTFLFSIQKR